MEYLTPQDVAALLKVSSKSVLRWAKSDPTMPALRIGGSVRFHRDRLERWLAVRTQGPGRHLSRNQLRPPNPAQSCGPDGTRALRGVLSDTDQDAAPPGEVGEAAG